MANVSNKDQILAALIREIVNVPEGSPVSCAPQLKEPSACGTKLSPIFWKLALLCLKCSRIGLKLHVIKPIEQQDLPATRI